MFDFHQKRKLRTIINAPITLWVILILTVIVGWSAYVRFDIAMEMRDRRIEAEKQTAALIQQKEVLEKRVEYLSSERGMEAEMRRQFDIALPGEQVVVIVDSEEQEQEISSTSKQRTETTTERRWYQFWR
ncbi:MAG: hypothetical protein RL097_248 [Candidatus Parcubacteria bacterium]|jgi:DNA topoisomerase IB